MVPCKEEEEIRVAASSPPLPSTSLLHIILSMYYSFQYIFFCFFGGFLLPAEGLINPSAGGRNLDFCHCSIPTAGLYRKLVEIAATH